MEISPRFVSLHRRALGQEEGAINSLESAEGAGPGECGPLPQRGEQTSRASSSTCTAEPRAEPTQRTRGQLTPSSTGSRDTAITCLTARSLEGFCTQAGEIPHQVDTRASIQAGVRAALVHVCGWQRWELGCTPASDHPAPCPTGTPRTAPPAGQGHAHLSRRPPLCSRPGTRTPRCRPPPGTSRRSDTLCHRTETLL